MSSSNGWWCLPGRLLRCSGRVASGAAVSNKKWNHNNTTGRTRFRNSSMMTTTHHPLPHGVAVVPSGSRCGFFSSLTTTAATTTSATTTKDPRHRRRRSSGRRHDRHRGGPSITKPSTTNARLAAGNDELQQLDDDEEEEGTPTTTNTKRLDVAIVGYPNAGKSQLLNALVGQKVAAVSRKRHTTRDGILGVATPDDTSQIVFCDTPGFMTRGALRGQSTGADLVVSAGGYASETDYALVVVDAAKTKLTPDYTNAVGTLMWNSLFSSGGASRSKSGSGGGGGGGPKFAIVLNKVDLVKPKSKLLDVAQIFGKMADRMILEQRKLQQQSQPQSQDNDNNNSDDDDLLMPEIFYTCAKQGRTDPGVQDVLQHLIDCAIPDRDWLLPPSGHGNNMVTPMDYPARVEEIIREKVYRTLHREVPHQIQQRNRQLELIRGDKKDEEEDEGDDEDQNNKIANSNRSSNNVILIHQDLMVRTKSHLTLLQKSSGRNLQRIHDAAVPDLRRLFQCEVFLTLSAKLITRNNRR